MSWTDERIDTLRKRWEAGQTASQIAEELGGVSRNAVIGKAHRLGLQSRPSPVKPNEAAATAAAAPAPTPAPAPAPVAPPKAAAPVAPAPKPAPPAPRPAVVAAPPVAEIEDKEEEEVAVEADSDDDTDEADAAPVVARPAPPILRSVGPGGFLRQAPGEQQAPITPAPPRRLVPAKPSAEMAGKTTLLDLNDKICKWPIGHPGEPDFHFCGEKVNPGFPYCVGHCGHAYQAQLPRRDRRPAPPLPFGGPRAR
ncbi:GcrA family cell cycle regulator [Sphingomonas sp. 10B4]|uniref:GcrA family cell cycle regulator n=1 Tax=Sphingomonas sp. 10B4 TaxID=3048575 RepID=UPI002AB47110|nr:GcrA family cell cycle regulator [Sphingomonas sp. 10B4]MDY7523062.1 GcrA family cell cycle regulator [Sphingomonas sp. 10B4]MEB0282840.1 GcrA family cell cycle regulator [Sphingomonas sp. 10B4]